MTTTRRRLPPALDPGRLRHALEVHQAELVLQNQELQVANEELRRINEELIVARDRFHALYDLAPTPFVTIDAARTIVDVNRAAEAILDEPRDHLVGGTLDVFVGDGGRAGFRDFVARVFAGAQGRCDDVAVVRRRSPPVCAMIDGVVLRETAAEAPRCVLAIVDVTARLEAERARRKAQDEILEVVSHDLRGPLNAISLARDALASDLSPDEHAECVAAIERSAARAEQLIQHLLGVAHIESGRLELVLQPLDLRELVGLVCRDHERVAAAARSVLTVSLGDGPQPIVGDVDRLHQVLSNLIGNALTHARGAAIAVVVRGTADEVTISVADDGPGIPAAELPVVFERYRQGVRHRGGAGLGLAIVKGLVEAHHGTVTATSELGHGARFVVTLPRRPRPPAVDLAG